MTKEQQRFYDIKHYNNYKEVGGNIDYAVIVDNTNKKVILQYEESENLDPKKPFFHQDWVQNFLFIPWPLKLDNKIVWTTLGYAIAYKSTNNICINEWLTQCSRYFDYDKVIQGYSFGSAMAKITSRHYTIRTNEKIKDLHTWGDVKCFLNPFLKGEDFAEECALYCCPNDGVTKCVPFFHRFKNGKRSVGPKFNLFKMLFHTPEYHADYEEYDYSEYEK